MAASVSNLTGVGLVDTQTNAGTITLPTVANAPNRQLIFKDIFGNLPNKSLTLQTQGGNTFEDGTTTKVLNNKFGFTTLFGSGTKWYTLSGTNQVDMTISSLTVSSINSLLPGTVSVQNLVSTTNDILIDMISTGAQYRTSFSTQQIFVSSINPTPLLASNATILDVGGLVQYSTLFTSGQGRKIILSAANPTNALAGPFFGFESYTQELRTSVNALVSRFTWGATTGGTNFTQWMTLSNGNVGINCNAPLLTLDVNGPGRLSSFYIGATLGGRSTIIQPTPFQTGGTNCIGILAENYDSVGPLDTDWLKLRGLRLGGFGISSFAKFERWGSNGFVLGSQTAGNTTSADYIFASNGNMEIRNVTTFSSIQIQMSSIRGQAITTSSLNVNSLTIGTGTGWVNIGALQTAAISSIQANTDSLYTENTYLGLFSSATAVQFFGLQGNYNNTVIAEISTGTGTQELLFFKGSNSSDRIRFQTTGTINFEPGVSARVWSSNTTTTPAIATPAMVILANSNVGVGLAAADIAARLDCSGLGRFSTLSTFATYSGSLYGGVFFA